MVIYRKDIFYWHLPFHTHWHPQTANDRNGGNYVTKNNSQEDIIVFDGCICLPNSNAWILSFKHKNNSKCFYTRNYVRTGLPTEKR